MKSKGRGEEFCYTSESMYTGDRRNPKYTAHDEEIKNTAEQKDKGPQKTEYKFRYDNFVDFDSHEEFCKDLQDALHRQSVVSVTPSKSPQCVMAEREQKTCSSCNSRSCDLKDSFMEAWKVNWDLQGISICPRCGEKTVYQIREIPKLSLKIHDVRMTGHPARLILNKTRNWSCSNCGHNISRTRIPGIQCVAGGEFTLRLLRSIFELNIDGVPNGFIAEGYDLKRNYVGELCRKFQAQTEKIFSERRNSLLADMPSDTFYGETVVVQGKKYEAIFDANTDEFYTILPTEDILTVFESIASDGQSQLVRKSLREPVALYAFSSIAPMRRKIAAGLFEVMQTAQVECTNKITVRALYLPDEIKIWLRSTITDDGINLWDLHSYLSDAKNFHAFYPRFGKAVYLSRTRKKAKEVANFINTILRDEMKAWEAESEKENRNMRIKRLRDFVWSIQHGPRTPRLPVVKLLEQALQDSEYPITERFRRLQFYNEPSLLSEESGYQTPYMNEDNGMPELTSSQIGRGIPASCLEHLLNNGLLQREPGHIKCVHHRKKQLDGHCTLDCPFLK